MFAECLGKGLDIQGLLVREMMIKRRRLNPHGPGDLPHADPGISFVGKKRNCCG